MANIWSEVSYNIGRIWMYINCCAAPTAIATNNGPICAGSPLNLSIAPSPAVPLNGSYTFAWTGPNGFTSNQQNPTIANPTVAASGTYSCTITSNCGNVTATTQVVVNPNPVASITNNTGTTTIDCNAPVINVTASGGGTYSWDNGLGSNASVGITTAGTFTVTVTNAQGCTNTSSITTTVAPTPTISMNPVTICTGQSTTLVATTSPAGGVIAWNTGQNTNSITVNPMQTTTYSATYTWNGCSASDSAVVTVNPTPTVAVNSDTICNGDTTILTATPDLPGGTFLWTPTNETTNTITVAPLASTTYQAQYVLNNCLSNLANGIVTIKPLPLMDFSLDTTWGCIPLNVTMSIDSPNPATTYQWTSTNNFTGSGPSVQNLYTAGGCNSIFVVGTLNGCIDSASMLGAVCTEGYPTAEFSSSVAIFTESSQSVEFTNSSIGGINYFWSFGDGETSTEFSPAHMFIGTQAGYTVSLTVSTAFGCSDSTEISIGAQVGGLYYIPNAFTPDGDPYNPTFRPLFPVGFDPYNYNMLIYNRWGDVVFETNNLEVGWDGSFGMEGLDAQPGVYTYFINIKMPDVDKMMQFTGHVTLVR